MSLWRDSSKSAATRRPSGRSATGATLDLSPRHTITLLHRLAAGGRLTRVKKGLYALNDPVTKLPKAHPFAIGTAMVTPSAVSHWSALQRGVDL